MRCPNCHEKNSGKTLHCIYCGSDLPFERRVNALTLLLLMLAVFQVILLGVMIVLLVNGVIAANYLKADRIDKAVQITSAFHIAESNDKFQEILKEKTKYEVDIYLNGKQSADAAVEQLEKFQFFNAESQATVAGAISIIQTHQKEIDDYTRMMNEVDQSVSNGKIKKAVHILHEIGEKYPQYKTDSEKQIRETIENTLLTTELLVEGIEKEIRMGNDDPDDINSVYSDVTSILDEIRRADTVDLYKIKASAAMTAYYADWLDYNQAHGMFWGKNGAFSLAEICEKNNDSEQYIASVNSSCKEYYQNLLHNGEAETVCKDIKLHEIELKKYYDVADISSYDSMVNQALEIWMESERTQYVILANQCRAESGLPVLQSNDAVKTAADSLAASLEKQGDDEYVKSVISQYVPNWKRAWWVYHQQYSSALTAIAESRKNTDGFLYWDEPTQIGVGINFDERTMKFDWTVIVLY